VMDDTDEGGISGAFADPLSLHSRLSTSPSQPQAMPPSSTPSTTINDLPPETIERVVKLAYPVMSAGGRQGRERTRFLLAVALVCRDWTLLAQEALWLDVRLDSQSISSFFAAGLGRFPVRRLDLEAYQANIPSVKSVLRDVRGVCELALTGGYIDTEWICGDNFKGTLYGPTAS
jgi:hypothetical protein